LGCSQGKESEEDVDAQRPPRCSLPLLLGSGDPEELSVPLDSTPSPTMKGSLAFGNAKVDGQEPSGLRDKRFDCDCLLGLPASRSSFSALLDGATPMLTVKGYGVCDGDEECDG
jgi:hypothetical protein